MQHTIARILVSLFIVTSCLGCVSSGKFRQKEQEARTLGKSLQELQGDYQKLSGENERLKSELKTVSEKLSATSGERDALIGTRKGLEETLKSTSDAKNQKIAELSQRIGDLERQNAKLREDIERVQAQKEAEVKSTSKTYEDLLDKMKNEISKGEVTISELKGKLTVNVVEAVLFDSGKAEVKPNGLLVLQKVVDILKTLQDKAIRVEGHTDNVPIVGALSKKYPSNWELSAARAITVTRYLQQQGIDPALLAGVAYGEHKPVAPNDSDEGRARNRRIEIVLVSKE